jgi:hypothetical protein
MPGRMVIACSAGPVFTHSTAETAWSGTSGEQQPLKTIVTDVLSGHIDERSGE